MRQAALESKQKNTKLVEDGIFDMAEFPFLPFPSSHAGRICSYCLKNRTLLQKAGEKADSPAFGVSISRPSKNKKDSWLIKKIH